MKYTIKKYGMAVLAMAVLCAVLLVGCASGSSDQGPKDLAQVREELNNSGAIAAVIYLGYYEEGAFSPGFYDEMEAQGYRNLYPFLWAIETDGIARNEGNEIYCIIPADPDASVEVTEWLADTETPGAPLYLSNGAPFLVQGNASDIMSNLSVTIEDSNGNVLSQYHPQISLKDGTVWLGNEDQPMVEDYTIYG